MANQQVLIIGGGVVGLSLAYELSRHGVAVRILERGEIGKEASWAGAGILPPANRRTAIHPYDQLRGLSYELHLQWSPELQAETGIHNGLDVSGGVYLARTAGEAASLHALAAELRTLDIACQRVEADELARLEPALAPVAFSHVFRAAYRLPDEAQLRNPRHLKALAAACQQRGVRIDSHQEITGWEISQENLARVWCGETSFEAEQYCLAAGAWTHQLLKRLNIPTGIMPIRGQMLLYRLESRPFRQILNEGPRYLVPRDDGLVLVGSTEEEAGFDKRNTPDAVQDLMNFAQGLVPALTPDKVQQSWAGLRPGSFDGLPYIGKVPGLNNTFAAAGHFRSGLYLAPGTARVLAQLMRGETPEIDLSPFSLGRG